jgi:hypothetical protein
MAKKIILLAAILATCFARAEFVVAPNQQATERGNTFTLSVLGGYSQSVYGARNFSAPSQIKGIAFRLDEGSGGLSMQAVIPRLVIRMTTYSRTFESFHPASYDNNKGSDSMTVFDGPIRWNATDLLGGSPNPFDLKIEFVQPFSYDPTKGALLMEFQPFGSSQGGVVVDSHAQGDSSIGWTGTQPTGFPTYNDGISVGNFVTQFDVTPVPEPRAMALIALGAIALVITRASR